MTDVFVFGSNEAGVHGAGAAKVAVDRFGAILGRGLGLQGNSYAIPTKDREIETLPLDKIAHYVSLFKDYARITPLARYYVTKIGCGLAGYTDEQIAPLFSGASKNCVFDLTWKPYLGEDYTYFEGEL